MSVATYGELLNLAIAEAGRGAAELAATSSVERPDAVLGAYTDVLRSIVEHTEFLYGSELNRKLTEWRSDLHVEVATDLWLEELRAMASPRRLPPSEELSNANPFSGGHECVDRWRRAARYVRAGQDLLATHFGPLDRWRSPDAWAVDDPDAQRAALGQIAEIAGVMMLAGGAVVDRCADRVTGDSNALVRAVAEHHSAGRMLSVGLREVREGDASGAQAIERLRAASSFETDSDDPVVRMQERLRSLRKQVFDLEAQEIVGAQVTKDVATALSGAHGHLSVMLRACAAGERHQPGLLGGWADTSLEASKAWARIRTEWNVIDSPSPGDPLITETAASLLRDFASVTRNDDGWKTAADMSGNNERRRDVRSYAEDSLQCLSGISSSLEGIAYQQVHRSQLLGHAQELPREFVTSDLSVVRARLEGKGVHLPRVMSLHLLDEIEAASGVTRDLATKVSEQSTSALFARDLPESASRRGAIVRHPAYHHSRLVTPHQER